MKRRTRVMTQLHIQQNKTDGQRFTHASKWNHTEPRHIHPSAHGKYKNRPARLPLFIGKLLRMLPLSSLPPRHTRRQGGGSIHRSTTANARRQLPYMIGLLMGASTIAPRSPPPQSACLNTSENEAEYLRNA